MPQHFIFSYFVNGESAWNGCTAGSYSHRKKFKQYVTITENVYWTGISHALVNSLWALFIKVIINSTWLSLYHCARYEKANQCQWQLCRRSIFCRENVIIRYTVISPEFLTLSPRLLVICRFNDIRLYHLFYN